MLSDTLFRTFHRGFVVASRDSTPLSHVTLLRCLTWLYVSDPFEGLAYALQNLLRRMSFYAKEERSKGVIPSPPLHPFRFHFHVSGIMTIKSARYPLLGQRRYPFNLKLWVLKPQLWVLELKLWILQIKSLKILWMCLWVRSGGACALEVEVQSL